MEDGFIPLGRSFFAHHLWEEERTYSRAEAWLDLIREAAWKEHKKIVSGKVIEVQRGGIVAAVRFLSDRWKWSNTKVCQFLEMLRSDGMITTEKRQGVTVVLLLNYERFNPSSSTGDGQEKRQGNDRETTGKRRGNDETEQGEQSENTHKTREELDDSEILEKPAALALATERLGIPPDFAGMVYEAWRGNGGCNGNRIPVPWLRQVSKRWRSNEGEQWKAGTHREQKQAGSGHAPSAPPKPLPRPRDTMNL